MVKVLNDSNFSDIETSTLPVLVDVSAEWCGPCRQLAPIVNKVAVEKSNSLVVYTLDVDESSNIASKLGIKSVPTLILFSNGKEVKRNVGFMSKEKLTYWINS